MAAPAADEPTREQSKPVPRAALRFAAEAFEFRDNGEHAVTAPVRMVARSGRPIEHWYWGKVAHDLSGMVLAKPRVPIDWCHTDELIGVLTKFEVEGGDLVASGYLKRNPARMPDHAAIVMNDTRGDEPLPYEASINFGGDGIRVQEVAAGEVTEVNGYAFEGPGVVVRRWPLRGVAVCPYGADGNTSTELSAADRGEHVPVTVFRQQENAPMSDQAAPVEAAPEAQPEAAVETPEQQQQPETPADDGQATAPEPEAAPAAAVEGGAAPEEPEEPEAEAPAQQQRPEPVSAALSQPPPAAVDAKAFVAAFGDVGARWFLEGKPFAECAAEFVARLRDEHAAALAARDAEVAQLRSRLDAVPRGAEPVTFSPADAGTPGVDPEQARKLGPNLARVAAGMTFKRRGE